MQLTSKVGLLLVGYFSSALMPPELNFLISAPTLSAIHFIAPWRLSRISVMQVVLFPVCCKSVTVVMGVLAGANYSLMCRSKGESVFFVSPGDTQNKIIYCSLLLGFKGSHLELCQMCFVVKTLSLCLFCLGFSWLPLGVHQWLRFNTPISSATPSFWPALSG